MNTSKVCCCTIPYFNPEACDRCRGIEHMTHAEFQAELLKLIEKLEKQTVGCLASNEATVETFVLI